MDYDNKREWYTSIDNTDFPLWNNKGTFPGAVFCGEWMMESENIEEALEKKFPDKYSAINKEGPGKELWDGLFIEYVDYLFEKTANSDAIVAKLMKLEDYIGNKAYLCGSSPGIIDIKFFMCMLRLNELSFLMDGQSITPPSCVNLWKYYARMRANAACDEAVGSLDLGPEIMEAFALKLKGYGVKKEPVVKASDLSRTCGYILSRPYKLPAFLSSYSPPSDLASQEPFSTIAKLQGSDYVIMFIGSVSTNLTTRELSLSQRELVTGDVDLYPGCTFSAVQNALLNLAGIKVYQYR
jgi:hypothetical protein